MNGSIAIRLNSLKPWTWLIILLVFQTSIHIPALNKPAVGTHVWRQCNSLAIARNYHEEDMRIWLPRIDKRYNFLGTTGPSFTAYEYGLALVYRVFGFSHTLHRFYSLFWSFFAIAGIFILVRFWMNSGTIAAFSGFALIAIPEFYYHSVNAIPDLAALALMLWGWHFGRRWLLTGKWNYWLLTAVFLTLAGMVKLQFLIAAMPLAAEALYRGYLRNFRFNLQVTVLGIIVAGLTFSWYAWARFLTFEYWLNEFVHDVRLPASWSDFFQVLKANVFSDIPETWVGYGLLPGWLAGIVYVWRNRWGRWLAGFTFVGILMVYLLLQRQFQHHGYYAIFMAPFIAITAAYGYVKLAGNRYLWLYGLLLLAPVWSVLRMGRNWEAHFARVPAGLLKPAGQMKILSFTDTSRRYIVGPDQTGCVYFYYLHAKGFPWYNEKDSLSEMTKWVRWGATGLITDQPDLARKKYSDSLELWEEHEAAGFTWFRVQLKHP